MTKKLNFNLPKLLFENIFFHKRQPDKYNSQITVTKAKLRS